MEWRTAHYSESSTGEKTEEVVRHSGMDEWQTGAVVWGKSGCSKMDE
jgi:hypothetical protein